jgi:hypothetical protein
MAKWMTLRGAMDHHHWSRCVTLALLTASCTGPTGPDVAPAVHVAEIAQTKSSELEAAFPPVPLALAGRSDDIRWTTNARLQHFGSALQLELDVELHNTGREEQLVSLYPPFVSIMPMLAAGSRHEALPGVPNDGIDSDRCSIDYGGPTALPPDGRVSIERTIELDPMPWPPGRAYRVTASSQDCRPDRLALQVLDVMLLPSASPDAVPKLVSTKYAQAR